MKKHDTYSPSKLNKLKLCRNFESSEEENEFSQKGTLLHLALETEDFSNLTDNDLFLVNSAKDSVNNIIDDKFEKEDYKTFKEKKVFTSIQGVSGTIDLLILGDKEAIAIDYKFGFKEVYNPEFNLQCQAYTLGIFEEFKNIETISYYIIQPTIQVVDGFTFTRNPSEKNIFFNILEVITSEKRYSPSIDACNYCKNFKTCPAVSLVMKETEKLKKDLKKVLFFEKWIKGIKDNIKEEMINGKKIDGFRIIQFERNSLNCNVNELCSIFQEISNFPINEILKHSTITLQSLNKLLGKEMFEQLKLNLDKNGLIKKSLVSNIKEIKQ